MPYFAFLLWLPVCFRIYFTFSLITFKAVNSLCPSADLLISYSPACTLRSSGKGLSYVSDARLKTQGHGAFWFGAPRLWNELPESGRHILCSSLNTPSKISFFGKRFKFFKICLIQKAFQHGWPLLWYPFFCKGFTKADTINTLDCTLCCISFPTPLVAQDSSP